MLDIVIPAYNANDTIIRTINSVLPSVSQQIVNNIIVVDDGSTSIFNVTLKELITSYYSNSKYSNSYKDKIVVLEHNVNLGTAAARNTGIKYSIQNNKNVKLIAFVDADDYFSSNCDSLSDAFNIMTDKKYSFLSCIKFQLNPVGFPDKYIQQSLYKEFKNLLRQLQLLTMMGIFRKDVLSFAAADCGLNPVPVGNVFRKRGEDFCFMNAIRKTTHVGMIFSNKNNYGLCHCYHENMFAERFFDSRLFGVNKYPLTNEENEIIKNQELLIKNNLINNLLKNNSNSELINFDNDFVPFIV